MLGIKRNIKLLTTYIIYAFPQTYFFFFFFGSLVPNPPTVLSTRAAPQFGRAVLRSLAHPLQLAPLLPVSS